MTADWDGKERRRDSSEMRDILIEVRNDMKHMVEWAKSHDEADNTRFSEIKGDVKWHSRILYGLLGAFALVELLLKLVK